MPWKYRKKINDYVTAVADDSEGEIWIYGDIVDDVWWDDEVSPKTVRNALKDMGNVRNVNVRVNSYGGSVYAGNAIINILDSYRKKTGCKINAYIEGIAASMSSGIPMVADKIYMAENAMYMLHKPWSVAYGNSYDLEKTIEELEKAEDTLVVNYMRKFNGTEDELRQLLAGETWLTADEALEWGLCDEIIEAVPIAASANGGIRINNREFITNAGAIAARFIPGTPIASAKAIVEKKEVKPKMYVYDEALKDFGITEETFKTLDMDAKQVLSVCNIIEPQEPYITAEMVENALGANLSPEALINAAKEFMNLPAEVESKAKAYDKLVSTAIDDAIKAGIKAKGDNFKESKWKKILSTLDYDEIIDQCNEWEKEAKEALNAGKRISKPWEPNENDHGNINPDNYNFC